MRSNVRRVGAVLLMIAGTVQSNGNALVHADEWRRFTSREGRFTVWMPGSPTQRTQQTRTAAGIMNQYVFKVVHDDSAEGFTIMYNDFPFEVPSARRDPILDSVAHARQQKGDQITAVKRISLNGTAGRELTITRASNPPLVMKVRIFLNKKRLYQVMAVTSREHAASPKVLRFLNSFSMTSKR